MEKHASHIISKHRSSFTLKSWLTTTIANSIKSKNKIYKEDYQEKTPRQKKIYERQFEIYWIHLTTLVRIAKYEYYKFSFKQTTNKKTTAWKTILKIINVKSKSLLVGKTITTNAELIAKCFNAF